MDNEEFCYDIIFFGASPLVLIEAAYNSLLGKSALVLERDKEIGGAWKTLNIFGLNSVENAVHYLLPDQRAEIYFHKNLGLKLNKDLQKYRVHLKKNGHKIIFKYDILLSKFYATCIQFFCTNQRAVKLSEILRNIWKEKLLSKSHSYYFMNGTPELMEKIKKLLTFVNVDIKLNTYVEKIHICQSKQQIEIFTKNKIFNARKILITHGSRIPCLTYSNHVYNLKEKVHLRPALHLFFRDNTPSKFRELIFIADPLIKYAHDITDIAKPQEYLVDKKLIVLALHPNVENTPSTIRQIKNKICRSGMVGIDSVLIDTFWQNVFLPRLDDTDLLELQSKFPDHIEILKTENFSACIGNNAERWSKVIPKI